MFDFDADEEEEEEDAADDEDDGIVMDEGEFFVYVVTNFDDIFLGNK